MDVDTLSREILAPALTDAGFKGRGRKFRRDTAGFEHQIVIGKGRQMMQGKFCITLYAHPRLDARGLPDFPLKEGEHWLWHRVVTDGAEDQWWPNEGISAEIATYIRDLLDKRATDWFARLDTVEHFAEDWFRRVFALDAEARRLGLLPARLAYLSAAATAATGDVATADRIAEKALELTGPRAVGLQAWIKAFRATLSL
jgi:hypothetical protein